MTGVPLLASKQQAQELSIISGKIIFLQLLLRFMVE